MYGSVVNRILESSRQPKIEVGMGATICMYSDRAPCTVVAIRYAKDGKTVTEIDVRGDRVGPNLAVWPEQRYEITPAEVSPDHTCEVAPNPIECVACRPVSIWRVDGKGRLRPTFINPDTRRRVMAPKGSEGISLGDRDYYHDPSF